MFMFFSVPEFCGGLRIVGERLLTAPKIIAFLWRVLFNVNQPPSLARFNLLAHLDTFFFFFLYGPTDINDFNSLVSPVASNFTSLR
jgi:hypothetical protein